jgi:hypothetical protein
LAARSIWHCRHKFTSMEPSTFSSPGHCLLCASALVTVNRVIFEARGSGCPQRTHARDCSPTGIMFLVVTPQNCGGAFADHFHHRLALLRIYKGKALWCRPSHFPSPQPPCSGRRRFGGIHLAQPGSVPSIQGVASQSTI